MVFDTKPDIKPPIQPDVWKCPVSGLYVPMHVHTNLIYRKELIKRCETDPRFRDSILYACSQSLVFWVGSFAWAFKLWDVSTEGKGETRNVRQAPFVPWPDQITLLNRLNMCILAGEPLLCEKSREVGATWLFLLTFMHHFLFRKDIHISMLSRVEDDVDQLGGDIKAYPYNVVSDPGTLFGKIDFAMNHLPAWMIPKMYRKRLHLVNQDNGSRLDGGASGVYTFSGQRRDAILFDEAAKNTNFKTAWEATTDVSLCKLAVSTPIAGAYFSRLRFSGQVKVETFGWWSSPEKARDLDSVEVVPGQWRLTSSWYREQCAKRSPNDIATNLDISHIESGSPFFEGAILTQRKKEHCRPPVMKLRIEFRPDVPEHEIRQIILRRDISKLIVTPDTKGPWSLWFNPAEVNPRANVGEYDKMPSGDDHVVFGIDVSLGMGASNSVCSVTRRKTRTKIAEYASSQRPPHAFAKDVAAAALWFGGSIYRPLCVPEGNGTPGFDFVRQLGRLYGYPEMYRATSVGKIADKISDTLGFYSNRQKKGMLLGNLRRLYAINKFINPSEMAVNEALDYIIAESGTIEPAFLTEEAESTKMAHGDRVIADALSVWPGSENIDEPDKPAAADVFKDIANAPYGSQGWRMYQRQQELDKQKKSQGPGLGSTLNLREAMEGPKYGL